MVRRSRSLSNSGVRHDDPPRYDLVVDRISHEVPLSGLIETAGPEGTIIINNPFWWSADDKVLYYSPRRPNWA